MCTPSISNVIYHKFSHGAAFYTLNGKNVNVMLECRIIADAMLVRPRVLAGKRQVRTQTKYVAKEIAPSVKYASAVKLTVKKVPYVTENIHTINGKT